LGYRHRDACHYWGVLGRGFGVMGVVCGGSRRGFSEEEDGDENIQESGYLGHS